jgi:uncharacterized membrane protein
MLSQLKNIIILFAFLVLPFWSMMLVNRIVGRELVGSNKAGRLSLALVFVITGITHFIQTEQMSMLLPPAVPFRYEIIVISGVVELLFAAGLIWDRSSKLTGKAVIAFLIAVFPSNVWAAVNYIEYGGHGVGPAYLLARGPLQVLLIFWTWWFSVRTLSTSRSSLQPFLNELCADRSDESHAPAEIST